MKKMILFVLALTAMVGTTNAKTFETTLWEGSSINDAEINIAADQFAAAKSGDQIRITFSFTTAGSMHLCYKTGEGGDWSAKAFNGISEWPYFSDNSVTSVTCDINAADLSTLQSYGMYMYGFSTSTITKVELTGEVTPTAQTKLLDASWTASWDAKVFAAQSGAKIGDVIRVKYTAFKDDATDWPWVQFYLMDAYGNNFVDAIAESKAKNAECTFDYEITDAATLEKIQTSGFSVKGDQYVLTSVKLLTYADSYDAVLVEMGSDGIRTWSHSKNLKFDGSGLTAYYASAVAKGTVTMQETATTWNYCGYILRGDKGTYTIPVVDDKHASYPAATYLMGQTSDGTVAASTTGKYHYIFGKKGSDYGFFRVMSDASVSANTAYLETDTDIKPSSDAPVLIDFGGNTTGINRVFSTADGNAAIYNISGQRVSQPTHGLYIVGGRKIMVK